ncbi:MAG: septum formation protein Maf [Bacteroidia bacterium]|nr:MAG: septum formation protein Maf [Bacteroidia bacterium]
MDVIECFNKYDIILASQSPRRRALMEAAGIPFRTMVRPTPEHFHDGMPPVEVVSLLCREKANCFPDELKKPDVVLITADTIVVHDGLIINKPADAGHAFRMLSTLSDSTHEVYTGVCIRHRDREIVFHDHSYVTFCRLSDEEIRYYVEQYTPYDKAGAYGIQEWIGYIGITGIRGSYHNVMGLPVHKVYKALKELLCE